MSTNNPIFAFSIPGGAQMQNDIRETEKTFFVKRGTATVLGDVDVNSYALTTSLDVSGIDGWRQSHEGDGSFQSFWTTSPTRDFLVSTLSRAKTAEERNDWISVISRLTQLPKIHYLRGETALGRPLFRAWCPWTDTYSRETLRDLGGRWNPEVKCWEHRPSYLGKHADVFELVLAGLAYKKRKNMKPNCEMPAFLYPHQVRGVEYAENAMQNGRNGWLLADDQGIGKTFVALALGARMIESETAKKCIVISQKNVFEQWRSSWDSRFGYLGPATVVSSEEFRKTTESKDVSRRRDFLATLSEASVIITNYEFLMAPEKMKVILPHALSSLVVFDEASECKEPVTTRLSHFESCLYLSAVSTFALALDGTPIINDIGEMHALVRLTDPSWYPYAEFAENHLRREMKRIYVGGKPRDITVDSYVNTELFRERIRPFFHKTKKAEVSKTLVAKNEHIVSIPVGEYEKKACDIVLGAAQRVFGQKISVLDAYERKYAQQRGVKKEMTTMVYMQEALNAPEAILASHGDSDIARAVVEDVRTYLSSVEKQLTAKEKKFIEMAGEKIAEGKKIVIFTFYAQMAKKLTGLCAERNIPAYLITGETKTSDRNAIEQTYRTGQPAVLVTTDAMKRGKDLFYVDDLIHYDLPWEPATLKQRSDRIHRLISETDKNIYFFVLDHEVERGRMDYITSKNVVSDIVLSEADAERTRE